MTDKKANKLGGPWQDLPVQISLDLTVKIPPGVGQDLSHEALP